MLKCDLCSCEFVYRIYSVGGGTFACEKCYRRPLKNVNVNLNKKVKLDSIFVTQAQIEEQDRMRILPYNGPNGTHFVGRMGENGRIQEREPDFR